MKTSGKQILLKNFLPGFDVANLIFIIANKLEKLVILKHYYPLVLHSAIFNIETVPIQWKTKNK